MRYEPATRRAADLGGTKNKANGTAKPPMGRAAAPNNRRFIVFRLSMFGTSLDAAADILAIWREAVRCGALRNR